MEKEIYLQVEGFNYFVSNCGNVQSEGGRLLSLNNSGPYCRVCLFKEGKRFFKSVHRLVAEAFLPNPENKPQVNHIDGNKKNNIVSNLEWATVSENSIHSYFVLGNVPTNIDRLAGFGSDNYRSKKVFQYTKEGDLVAEYGGVRSAGRYTGIDHRSIASVASGSKARKSAGGYLWKYE